MCSVCEHEVDHFPDGEGWNVIPTKTHIEDQGETVQARVGDFPGISGSVCHPNLNLDTGLILRGHRIPVSLVWACHR